jgi:hypothetical protein
MQPLQSPEGEITATHQTRWFVRFLAVVALILPGLGLAALAVQLPAAQSKDQPVAIVIGLALVALGILGFVQQRRSKVVVRTDGLERWGLRGKLWALRWADMVEMRYHAVKMRVYYFIPAGTIIQVKLTDPNGKKHRIPSNMKGMDLLAERVADQQTAARFPEARAAVDRGEEVRFGKALIVDREKVSARKLFGGYKSCPLTDIEKVAVEGGFLRIRQRGKFLGFGGASIAAIPNVFLLLRLLDSLVARATTIPQDRDFALRHHVG